MAGYQPYMPPSALVQQPMGQQFVPQVPVAPAYIPVPPQPPPAPQYMQPAVPPQYRQTSSWAPQPPQRAPMMPAMPAAPQPQYQQQASTFHVQGLPFSKFGYYGYVPDNMWSALASVPPPWRPQQAGETFGRRVVVNTFLRMLEILLQELVVAVRQMLFPPMLQVPPSPSRA